MVKILVFFVIQIFFSKGVLKETQNYFKIDDSSSGLLQTVFICSYMLLAPLFGYLGWLFFIFMLLLFIFCCCFLSTFSTFFALTGDRYPRKWIIIFGVSFWSMMTFLGSFVPADVITNLFYSWKKNFRF